MALFCYGRLGTNSVILAINRLPTSLGSAQYAQITYKKYENPKTESYEVKNRRMKRPISPHLTIYKIQMNSSMSISHRFAGMFLSGYILVLGIGGLLSPNDISHYVAFFDGLNLSGPSWFLIKAIYAAPFSYHFANGLRHLYWDTARGLTMKEIVNSGYGVLIVTAVMTFLLASL